jgi:hypothetical protein
MSFKAINVENGSQRIPLLNFVVEKFTWNYDTRCRAAYMPRADSTITFIINCANNIVSLNPSKTLKKNTYFSRNLPGFCNENQVNFQNGKISILDIETRRESFAK